MQGESNTVSAIDVLKGAVSALPELPKALSNLWAFASLRQSSRRTLASCFEQQVEKRGEALFLMVQGQQWSYQEANRVINQTARAMASLGIKTGDCVGILAGNSANCLFTVIACAKLGAVAALLNPNQRGEVLLHSIAAVRPTHILANRAYLEQLAELAKLESFAQRCKAELYCLDAKLDEVVNGLNFRAFAPLIQRADHRNLPQTRQLLANSPCFYIFTSGTTGLPKASVMSHYRWLQAACGMGAAVRLTNTDRFYCCLPLYHNNALTVSLGLVIQAGAALALDEKFSASQFWSRIAHYEATAFCYIGELLRYLLNSPPSMNDQNHSIRLIVGNGLRPELWDSFEARFGIERIFEFYGASESNFGFMNAFGLRKTVGFSPIPYSVIACDPDTEMPVRMGNGYCHRVKQGEVGLLISEVTNWRPFDGYTDQQANEKKLLRNVFSPGDCWFNSGDLVREQGWRHVQFVDRLGDTFRWKGENVATSEVEAAFSQVPWVAHAVVYGVQVPNADGRAGMAAICLHPEAQMDGAGLAQVLKSSLPSYAVPLYIRILGDVQTTGTFKYQKAQLKKEGFATSSCPDPVYALNPERSAYQLISN